MPIAHTSPAHDRVPGANKGQQEFEQECIQHFGEVVALGGVPRSVGHIYGLLFATPRPLSFSDIVARLGISKGSASQGLQLLRSLGAVRPVPDHHVLLDGKQGHQAREYFEPELGLRKLVSGILQQRLAPMAVESAARITRLRRLAEGAGKHNAFLVERVEQLETWRKRFKTALPLLNALFGPKNG